MCTGGRHDSEAPYIDMHRCTGTFHEPAHSIRLRLLRGSRSPMPEIVVEHVLLHAVQRSVARVTGNRRRV